MSGLNRRGFLRGVSVAAMMAPIRLRLGVVARAAGSEVRILPPNSNVAGSTIANSSDAHAFEVFQDGRSLGFIPPGQSRTFERAP